MHPEEDILPLNFEAEHGQKPPPKAPREGVGSRILLVEDDPAFSDFLAWCLAERGYAVQTAANTREALELIGDLDQPGSFDIVLSDVAMPGGSGTELLFSPVLVMHKTPVILMSAFGTKELEDFIADAGGEFLSKPFNVDSLFQCVLAQLRGRYAASVSQGYDSGTGAPS
ncbi:MAG: response regulator [Pseudomonadota bacterium]